jgi:beta-galactosidase
MNIEKNGMSRRGFVRSCAAAKLAPIALGALLHDAAAQPGAPGAARYRLSLNNNWLFGKRNQEQDLVRISLPHCVAKLSWQDWDAAAWQDVWLYRKRFTLPREFRNRRVFVQFDGVMTGATPAINGHALPEHLGGYLPFRYEITRWVTGGENVLSVEVDSRWKNVPPEGSPDGPRSIDYLEPGGIVRDVSLHAVPRVFIDDVFAKPVEVLGPGRRVEVACSIDSAAALEQPVVVKTELLDGSSVIASAQDQATLQKGGKTDVRLTLSKLGDIALWEPGSPKLYEVATTLSIAGKPVHDHRVRIGFREARFDVDGFFLNGKRTRLFGLNRHELFPYVGAAMPRRVMRRDAEILRREFHCNIVRCSHYPQSEAFLDACDELGLMVWEEIPGWQYLGDAAWQDLAVRDVRDMVCRDRNRPSVVIWGVRINESASSPALYKRTRELAHSLDDSRPTSGSMTSQATRDWRQDVFALDDYHAAPDGSVGIREPLPGLPYMLAETVGQYNYATAKGFGARYRKSADVPLQQAQALRHAQAHDRAAAFPRCAGVIAWCAFDYGSLMNSYRGVKCPGVADVFRIPKLGAAFYQAQVSPGVRPVIVPNFYWDFGPETPHGPGAKAAIFSNCDRLEIFLNGKRFAEASPDRAGFPHLQYPPFFCDLTVDGALDPELRIDGYVEGKLAVSRSFSSDRTKDQFSLAADDEELVGDGSDAARLVFQTLDRYGAVRPMAGGRVAFEVAGPGAIVGDNPFHLADSGGAGAVWLRTRERSSGIVTVTATHSTLGKKSVAIRVKAGA